ncbi:DUF998 domain-containing protein [Actinoplanes sp. NPDC049118]|uniref:DUF998 domain-containing protein n=1 Tax=Actinoplanes sp. NPDC049118 TaxID=3155769 RepID=UPI0033FEDC33
MTALAARTPSATTSTRTLLTCVAVAGPLWASFSLAQAATRAGFDLTRHPLSALSNGSLGWLQIANFTIAGILTLAGAVGLRRALGGGWVPRLVAAYGLGLLAAGVLVMDPADGFPAGTPYGMPALSWHGYGHMAAGMLAFTASIAACYALARRFARSGNHRAAMVSIVAGTALLTGDLWAMGGGAAGSLTLAVGAITASLWISAVAGRLAMNN